MFRYVNCPEYSRAAGQFRDGRGMVVEHQSPTSQGPNVWTMAPMSQSSSLGIGVSTLEEYWKVFPWNTLGLSDASTSAPLGQGSGTVSTGT